MNELQVVVDQKPGVIGFNFEEIRDELQARMDLYKNATFTDEYRVYAKNEDKTLYISKSLSDGLIRKTNANEVSSPKIIHIGDLPIGAKFAGKQRVFSIHDISPTLMENMYKDPKNYGCIPKVVVKNKVRKLSPFECFALMGVHKEDDYKLCNSGLKKTKLYKLSGNSIVTNCMTAMFEELLYPTGNSYVEKDGQLSLF